MVFDLPLFRFQPSIKPIRVSFPHYYVCPSATANGGSETTPYFGSSSSQQKLSAAKHPSGSTSENSNLLHGSA
jgi:hypothetical protein